MIRIFIDFDGTITKQDVGDSMFLKFGGEICKDILDKFYSEQYNAIECYQLECKACGQVDIDILNSFIDNQEIDESFLTFIQYCQQKGYECNIVSDGMDYYIDRILKRFKLDTLKVFSNKLELQRVNSLSKVFFKPSFPFTDEECKRCACCKRNLIVTISGEQDIIVYIGDGYSDRCPVRYADVIFAKDALLKYCKQQKIPCFEYKTFQDIMKQLDDMNQYSTTRKKRYHLKKRYQAELARRELFLCE